MKYPRQAILWVVGMQLLMLYGGCMTWTRAEKSAIDAYNSGNAFRNQRRLRDAALAYREALESLPRMTAASFNLALTLADLGQETESLDILLRLKREESSNLQLIRAMGWVSEHKGDSAHAIAYYLEALSIFDGDQESLRRLVDLHSQLRQYGLALEYQQKLIGLDDSAENHRQLARLHTLAGSHREAFLQYQWVLSGSTAEPEILLQAGETAQRLNRVNEAAQYYRRASQGNAPESSIALFRLAQLLLLHFMDFGLGLETLKQAIDSGFQDDDAIHTLLKNVQPELIPSIKRLLSPKKSENIATEQGQEDPAGEEEP